MHLPLKDWSFPSARNRALSAHPSAHPSRTPLSQPGQPNSIRGQSRSRTASAGRGWQSPPPPLRADGRSTIHQRRRQMIRQLIQHQTPGVPPAHRQLQPPLLTLRHPPDGVRTPPDPAGLSHTATAPPLDTPVMCRRGPPSPSRPTPSPGTQPHDLSLADGDQPVAGSINPASTARRRLPGPVRADDQQPVALEPRRRRRIQAPGARQRPPAERAHGPPGQAPATSAGLRTVIRCFSSSSTRRLNACTTPAIAPPADVCRCPCGS